MSIDVIKLPNMPKLTLKVCAPLLCVGLYFSTGTLALAETDAERIARLEQRLLALESRLAEQEQETKEVKVLATTSAATGGESGSILGNAATFDILAGSAWRNLRWTQEEQWAEIRPGISEERVIELLGYPPRSVDSLKPRIDKVFWYETSLRDTASSLRGKISFRDGRAVYVTKPNFSKETVSDRAEEARTTRQRLP